MTGLVTFDVDTPRGALRCAATPKGLARVVLPGGEVDADLARLSALHGPPRPVTRHPAAAELRAYVAGKLREFETRVDFELATPFARKVLTKLRDVPYGRLTTYGALARDVGRPGAAQAVGGAVGSNPVPIVVPCHRVVAANGIGGFGGGLPMKRWLLELEGVDPDQWTMDN